MTLEYTTAKSQFQSLLDALDLFPDLRIVFTMANADTEGRVINEMIMDYTAKRHDRSVALTSMGQLRYLSAMKYSEAVVGNSSSGIIEAPSFKVPTVNIGDRQKGRVKAESVIDCLPEKTAIAQALELAFSSEFTKKAKGVTNPYEKESTAFSIKEVIKNYNVVGILKKEFYDLSVY